MDGQRQHDRDRCSFGEISGAHVSEATALWLRTMAALTAGETRYFAADQTSFRGAKIGRVRRPDQTTSSGRCPRLVLAICSTPHETEGIRRRTCP